MRIALRTSRWAVGARRLGSFALPLSVVPVLMHRANAITTEQFVVLAVFALLVTLAALGLSLGAIWRLWMSGDLGWDKAFTGLLLSLACLAPLALWTGEALLYPSAADASTDRADPPPLLAIANAPVSVATAQLPDLKDRNYPVPPGRMFPLVDKLVGSRGWTLEHRSEPGIGGDDGQINAIATTPLGFRDQVSIRIASTDDGGSRVSMRSASLTRPDEPGSNVRRIESFLGKLDDEVTALMKDGPVGGDSETDVPAATAAPVPAPAPRGKRH